ncbi:MAG: T9SS type A sorting domain-containing protein [Bacteroidetes bacterium]|nr:T9SS type A sorting domain-containing protein [Bacteroidota bacterium]
MFPIQIAFPICTINTAPIVSFYSSDTVLCEKSAIDFFDISTNNPTQWQWSFPGASPSSSTVQNPTGIYYPTYGTYPVTLVATNANGSDSLTITQYITVVANPPAPSVTVNGSFMCCNNVAIWYQWYYNNVAIPNANAMCYTAMQPGNYYVLITDSNGCNSGSGQIVISVVSLSEISVGINFNAWYDATVGNVNVVINKRNNEIATITIYDVLGQAIMQLKEENYEGNIIKVIPLPFIAKGIYMIEVATRQKTCTSKLMIH